MRNFTFGLMLLLLNSLFAENLQAQNLLKIGSYSVNPATEFTVQLEAENSNPFVAFQADIPLPAGFSYVDGSVVLNATRITGHSLSASLITGNILRLIGFSVSNTEFSGTSGTLVSFTLKSGSLPGTYPLVLQNPLLGDSQSANILTSSVNGAVTVLAPNLKLSATELNYGRVALETTATQTFQITNDGNRDLTISDLTFNDAQFTTTEVTPFTISANNSHSVSVLFAPTAKGTFAKQIQVSCNDPDQPTATIALNAIAFAVNEIHTGNLIGASSSTGMLDFSLNNMEVFTGFQFDINLPHAMTYSGTAQLFRSADHSVSVNQVNTQTLRVLAFSGSNQSFTGTDGKVLSLDFALNGVAGWYPVNISNVIIANSLGENIVSASFGGSLQITSPDIDAPTTLSFGDVSILSSSTKLHRVYNYGQEALTITQLLFNNDYFRSNQTLPVTIQPSAYLDLPVEFIKAIKGNVTGTLKIVSNDPDENPFTIQLTGNAFAPNYLLIQPLSINSGEIKNIPIEIENEEPFVAFQFDLSFPIGLTPDLNAIALSSRKQDHSIVAIALSATSMRILAYSIAQKTFTGNTGAILNIPFLAEASLTAGTYNLTFSNTVLSNANSENILYSSTNGSLNVTTGIKLKVKVLLESAFSGSAMSASTLGHAFISKAQPYSTSPWNFSGSESVASIPTDVVDWVLVELRQATSPELATSFTMLAKRAAFLKSDGSIVDLDGSSPVQFINSTLTSGNNLYVVVRHRNHLAIMSATGAILNNGVYSYDFTTGLAQAFGGGNGYKQVGTGKYAMVVGDVDQDGNIFVSDYNVWATSFGSTNGYLKSDLDMDGNVFVSDYNKWAVNFGSTINAGLKSAQTKSKYFSCVPK